MSLDFVLPEEVTGAVKQLNAFAAAQAKTLRFEADTAERVWKTWQELEGFLARGWSFHVLHLLGREKALVAQLRADQHPAVAALDELARLAQEHSAAIRRRFPAYLEEASRSMGLPLDQDSRHPLYRIEGGFFRLEVDEQRGMARLSDNEARFDEVPADVGAIVELVAREHKRVFGRPYAPVKFLKRLRQDYVAILKKEHWPDGQAVPLRHITRRMGKNVKGFRTDEFLIDLSRLVEQGADEIEGYRLSLQHTKDTSQGMLLHGAAGRGGYTGFVIFRKVDHEQPARESQHGPASG